jgi:hypothetical protein
MEGRAISAEGHDRWAWDEVRERGGVAADQFLI